MNEFKLIAFGLALAGLLLWATAVVHKHDAGIRKACEDAHAAQAVILQKQANERESYWQANVTVLNEDRQNERQKADAALAAALQRLRDRPERPAGNLPASACAASAACTGAGLYRPDAEFLVGFAAAASAVAADLATCKAGLTVGR